MRFALISAVVMGALSGLAGVAPAVAQAPAGLLVPVFVAPDVDLAAP